MCDFSRSRLFTGGFKPILLGEQPKSWIKTNKQKNNPKCEHSLTVRDLCFVSSRQTIVFSLKSDFFRSSSPFLHRPRGVLYAVTRLVITSFLSTSLAFGVGPRFNDVPCCTPLKLNFIIGGKTNKCGVGIKVSSETLSSNRG